MLHFFTNQKQKHTQNSAISSFSLSLSLSLSLLLTVLYGSQHTLTVPDSNRFDLCTPNLHGFAIEPSPPTNQPTNSPSSLSSPSHSIARPRANCPIIQLILYYGCLRCGHRRSLLFFVATLVQLISSCTAPSHLSPRPLLLLSASILRKHVPLTRSTSPFERPRTALQPKKAHSSCLAKHDF
jgi:hypothetical protein